MKYIAVIGAGISGVSSAQFLQEKGFKTKVFEKSEKIGGLIQCDIVDGVLFHKVGGHVFNSKIEFIRDWFWNKFDKDTEFVQQKRNAKILLEGSEIGYPIENHLWQLSETDLRKILAEIIYIEDKKIDSFNNFEEFLRGNFGDHLFKLYFEPYNKKIWKTKLDKVPISWLKDKLPMPNTLDIIISNIQKKEEGEMVHSSFFYPREGGSQFIINRLAEGLDISINTPVKNLLKREDGRYVINDQLFDGLIFTGNIKHFLNYISFLEIPQKIRTRISQLKVNGTSNVLCEIDKSDLSWLYLPEANLNAHRIIYTGNFSPHNNGISQRTTCTIEFSGKVEREIINKTLSRIPRNIKPIAYNYEPNSYVIQEHDTKQIIKELKLILNKHNIYITGRFAEWEYYNMDTAINAAKDTIDNIIWL